eukprot:scaffold1133_cov294-Chaetoceros_neogracile.AAC.19
MNFKCSNLSFLTHLLPSLLLTAAEKSCNEESNSSYDPRVRPWYVAASSGPKDIILVLDISGSMEIEQRIDKLKLAASRVISTLGIGDYFAVVSFSDDATQLGTEDLLLSRATDDNKKAMLRYIDALEPGGGTVYSNGFDKAFDIFEKSNSVEVSTSCRQAILFVTDGAMGAGETEQDLFKKIDQERKQYTLNDKKPPVIFTYSFGDSASEEVPQNLACRYDGVWSRISDEENLADSMGGYYKYFSYGLGDQRNDDFVAWVSPYLYANGGSLGTTASAPVYDRSSEHPILVGVVGFDFTLAAMERALGEEGRESRDIIIEDIVERSIAKCPIFNLTDCQMESLRMYGTDPTGFPAAICYDTCPSDIPSLESVYCTTEDLSSVSLWNNVNVRNYSFEERACCNVGESRVAGTVTLSEVREQVCVEEGFFTLRLIVLLGTVGGIFLSSAIIIVIAFGKAAYKRKRNTTSDSTIQETADYIRTRPRRYGGGVSDSCHREPFPGGVAASPSAPKLPAPIPFSGVSTILGQYADPRTRVRER